VGSSIPKWASAGLVAWLVLAVGSMWLRGEPANLRTVEIAFGIVLLVVVSIAAARALELPTFDRRPSLTVVSAIVGHIVLTAVAFFAFVPGPGTGDDYWDWFFLPPLLLSIASLASIVWALAVRRVRKSAV
jgi:hypothetical protein